MRSDLLEQETHKSEDGEIFVINVAGIYIINVYQFSGENLYNERRLLFQDITIFLSSLKN